MTATTWNPGDKTANITLSNGNLTGAGTNASDGGVRSTASKATSGKYYFEFTLVAVGGGDSGFGISTASATLTALANSATGGAIQYFTSGIFYNGSFNTPGVGTVANGDVLCCALDLTNSRIWWRKNNGSWFGGSTSPGDPASNLLGLNISSLFPTNTAFAAFTANSASCSGTVNFGDSAFAQTPPTGFVAWDLVRVRRNEAFIIG